MADDLSLWLRLRGDSSGAVKATAETRAAVNQLRQSVGSQLNQSIAQTNQSLSGLGENLTNFAVQRIPLVGNAFAQTTRTVQDLTEEFRKGGPHTANLAKQIDGIAKSSGKSSSEIANFLTSFRRLETQTAKNDAAFKLFGGSVDLIGNKTANFLPELEQASSGLALVSTESAGAAAAIGGMALPIGIAVAAFAALAVGAVAAAREVFELSKKAAEFQGRMFDLSQQTGLSVETLSAFEIVAKTTGGNIDNIAQSVFNFQRKLDDAQDPLSKTGRLFGDLGITTSDTETALRSAFTALAAMPEGFEQTNAAAELFGARGGKQILAILKETNGDLDAAIKRFREMGILIETDAARAADKFNDQLAELDFQLRASSAVAAQELIPAFIDIIRVTADLVRDLNPLLKAFGNLAGPVVRTVGQAMKGLGLIVGILTHDYKELAEAIKESNEQATIFRDINSQAIPSQNAPGPSPVALPRTTPLEDAKTFAQAAEATAAAAKRQAQIDKQFQDELFQQGRISRQQHAEAIIRINKFVLENEQRAIGARLAQKENEIKQLDQSDVQYRDNLRQAAVEVQKLQQEALDKEADVAVKARVLRANAAKERSDETRRSRAEETETLVAEFDRQIANTQAAIQRGAQVESEGLALVEALERGKIDARREGLEEQKRIGGLTIEEQRALNRQIAKLNQDADRLKDEQNNARLQREREVSERIRDIKLGEVDTVLALQRIAGERTIAAIETQARLRVKTEEGAAREILRIKLDLIDQEIEATEARLKVAGSIVNVNERLKAEAELNNQIKILKEQRTTIEADGDRAIEDGRQKDLDNERRYADDLQDIKDQTLGIEQDTAEEVIRLMRLHFADRGAIIRAQRDLDLAEEAARHQRVTNSIKAQQSEVDEQIRILEQHIKSLKIGTTEEIEQYERLIEELEKLRLKREELKRQQDAEGKKTQTRKRRTTDKARKDIRELDPFDKFRVDIKDIQDFAQKLEDSVVPIGEILANTFNQVADAIGSVVSNWVLLGETGPAVMRKILAAALASIAAEAAVNAIKMLAVGFANLAIGNFKGASDAFISAAIWGSIAGVAAIAGRGVAGDLFKPKDSKERGTGTSGTEQINPLTLGRNQPQTQTIIVKMPPINVNPSAKFGQAITAEWARDYVKGGVTRQVVINDDKI